MMNRGITSKIKASADCREIFRRFWPSQYREVGNCFCPFHNDKEPSFQLDRDLGHCHSGCGSFDAIALYAKGAGISNAEAIKALAAELGIDGSLKEEKEVISAKDTSYFKSRFKKSTRQPIRDEMWRYLENRKLKDMTRHLQERGLVGYDSKFRSVVFLLRDKSEQVVGLQCISDTGKKHLVKGSSGKTGYFHIGRDRGTQVITEGVFDLLSVCSVSEKFGALATISANTVEKLRGLNLNDPVLFFDRDAAGQKATANALKIIPDARVVDWSMAPKECKDVNDILKGGHTETIVQMIEGAKSLSGEEMKLIMAEHSQGKKDGKKSNSAKETVSKIIVETFLHEARLFHTPRGEAYAVVPMGDHSECWPLLSGRLKQWVSRIIFEVEEKVVGGQAYRDAVGVLAGIANQDRPQEKIHIRIGHSQEKIYLDLCNTAWEVVEISRDGWGVLNQSPVNFVRSPGALPLPKPTKGGNLLELRKFLNLDDEPFILAISWLLGTFHPSGPYPILVLTGEQGTTKSTAAQLLKGLVDPHQLALRTVPREERDLSIAASNAHILIFDNLSSISSWLSDGLCRVATGGGLAVRKLYSGDEEDIFQYCRPLILAGIGGFIYRHDLTDRCIFTELSPIPEAERTPLSLLMAHFEAAKPEILGGLLDAVCMALQNQHTVTYETLPRMADFALWVQAAEPALPWSKDDFIQVYTENRQGIVEQTLEGDLVGSAIRKFMEPRNGWEGTASDLLGVLEGLQSDKITTTKEWPKSGRVLSSRLKRSATFLRTIGIDVHFEKTKNARLISIQKGDAKGDAKSDMRSILRHPESQIKSETYKKGDDGDARDAKHPSNYYLGFWEKVEKEGIEREEKEKGNTDIFASPSSLASPPENEPDDIEEEFEECLI